MDKNRLPGRSKCSSQKGEEQKGLLESRAGELSREKRGFKSGLGGGQRIYHFQSEMDGIRKGGRGGQLK